MSFYSVTVKVGVLYLSHPRSPAPSPTASPPLYRTQKFARYSCPSDQAFAPPLCFADQVIVAAPMESIGIGSRNSLWFRSLKICVEKPISIASLADGKVHLFWVQTLFVCSRYSIAGRRRRFDNRRVLDIRSTKLRTQPHKVFARLASRVIWSSVSNPHSPCRLPTNLSALRAGVTTLYPKRRPR